MHTLVTVIHIVTCLFLVLFVLVQSGKGAEISTSLGGSSQTVFGTSGGANFLTRITSGLAAVFMVTSIVLTLMGGQSKKSLFEGMATPAAPAAQSAPASNPVAPSAPAQSAAPAGK